MKQQIHQLAAAAAAAASAYPAALAQLAAASSGAFSSDFAAASALAAVSVICTSAQWLLVWMKCPSGEFLRPRICQHQAGVFVCTVTLSKTLGGECWI